MWKPREHIGYKQQHLQISSNCDRLEMKSLSISTQRYFRFPCKVKMIIPAVPAHLQHLAPAPPVAVAPLAAAAVAPVGAAAVVVTAAVAAVSVASAAGASCR
jgi:hypothetical protein